MKRSILCALLLAACSRGRDRSPDVDRTQAIGRLDGGELAAPPEDAIAKELSAVVTRAIASVQAVDTSCGKNRGAYLATRQSLLASFEVWRAAIAPAAELVFGPRVPQDEGAGALAALDRELGADDCAAIRKQTRLIDSALRTASLELEHAPIAPSLLAQALSDQAYDLGEAVLESTPYVPEADDASLADVLGLLDGIETGLSALHVDLDAALAPFARIKKAAGLSAVQDRASLVRATGALGMTIRASLGGRPPFSMDGSSQEVSVFTLPGGVGSTDPARAALGKTLFSDRRLSRGGVRSCADCHLPSKEFQDGLAVPKSLVPGTPLKRNTPTLLYVPLAARLTWDGRLRTADRQALSVIHTEAEMGLRDDELTRVLADDPNYARAFQDVFGREVTVDNVGEALSAYEARTLVVGRAPIDRFDRDGVGLSDDARAGLDVFAGKGRCARCHVPPVWGGTRPPDFTVAIFSVLGVPTAPGTLALDSDPGRGAITHLWGDAHAFKVPTLRNSAKTAPYFHHGMFRTLEQVIDFYDQGGGRGLGLQVPNQDPDVRLLHLSPEEKRLLLGFIRNALNDAP